MDTHALLRKGVVLAGSLKAPLHSLSLSNPKLSDSDLIELLNEVEKDAFVPRAKRSHFENANR